MDRPFDQIAAIVEHIALDTFWQGWLNFCKLFFYAFYNFAGVGPAQAEHQSFRHLVGAILADRAVAGQCANAHVGHIGDGNGYAVLGRDDDGQHIFNILDAALGADQQGFLPLHQAASTVVAVVGPQGINQHLRGHATGGHAAIAWNDFVAPRHAA